MTRSVVYLLSLCVMHSFLVRSWMIPSNWLSVPRKNTLQSVKTNVRRFAVFRNRLQGRNKIDSNYEGRRYMSAINDDEDDYNDNEDNYTDDFDEDEELEGKHMSYDSESSELGDVGSISGSNATFEEHEEEQDPAFRHLEWILSKQEENSVKEGFYSEEDQDFSEIDITKSDDDISVPYDRVTEGYGEYGPTEDFDLNPVDKFTKWFIAFADVTSQTMLLRRKEAWIHHMQWARRSVLNPFYKAKVEWDYTRLSPDYMYPQGQVVAIRANSTDEAWNLLSTEPLSIHGGLTSWRMFEMQQNTHDNVSWYITDPILFLGFDGEDDERWEEEARRSDAYHCETHRGVRLTQLGHLTELFNNTESSTSRRRGLLAVLNSRTLHRAKEYVLKDPLVTSGLIKRSILSPMNIQDVSGLHHLMPMKFSEKKELDKLHMLDPEDLLYMPTQVFPGLETHAQLNQETLDTLQAHNISYAYTRLSWTTMFGKKFNDEAAESWNKDMVETTALVKLTPKEKFNYLMAQRKEDDKFYDKAIAPETITDDRPLEDIAEDSITNVTEGPEESAEDSLANVAEGPMEDITEDAMDDAIRDSLAKGMGVAIEDAIKDAKRDSMDENDGATEEEAFELTEDFTEHFSEDFTEGFSEDYSEEPNEYQPNEDQPNDSDLSSEDNFDDPAENDLYMDDN